MAVPEGAAFLCPKPPAKAHDLRWRARDAFCKLALGFSKKAR